MFEDVRTVVATLKEVVRDFEPGLLDGRGAVALVALFSEAEHVCAAGKALAARRVSETGAHRELGERSAAHLLATISGVTVGAAEAVVKTTQHLASLPLTDSAFRSGELSEAQAREITFAARQDPSCEERLVQSARDNSLKGLKTDCQRAVAASVADDEAWARRLHETRAAYRWTERQGAHRLDARLAPDAGARVFAALDAETDLMFREARGEGRTEPRSAYMADALVRLITNGPSKPLDVRLSADMTAIARGHVVPGERCEIAGVGPIPVTTARAMLADARITTMVRDGDDITHVSSMTRTIPARLRRYLEERYAECGRSGCNNTQGLVIDHVVDFAVLAATGELPPTTEHNTWRLCKACHDLKTYRGWQITGSPGSWDLVPPGHPDGPDPP
jgi:hypothetical protein